MPIAQILRILYLVLALSGLAGGAYMLWQYTSATSTAKVAVIEATVATASHKQAIKAATVQTEVINKRDDAKVIIRDDRQKARVIEQTTNEVHHEWTEIQIPASVRSSLCSAWGESC